MVMNLSQREFYEDIFDYRPGESAVWICPTGGGKSHHMYTSIDCALKQQPHLQVTAGMPKPSDATTDEWAGKLDFKIADSYPFTKWPWQSEPRGRILWPPHIKDDEDLNEAHLQAQFKAMLSGEYWRGNRIVALDDSYRIVCGLKLGKQSDKFLTEGRSNGAGLFGTLQQPRGTVHSGSVSSFWYSQPTHLFLGKDGNADNRQRFSEIAMGLDPRMISDIVANLKTYRVNDSAVSDFLYLDRRGPYMAIVTPF
jgi:hypothetical protein